MSVPTFTYPRETVEFLPLTVKVNDTPVSDYEVTVLPYRQRPVTGWAACATLGSEHGVMVGGQPVGVSAVWTRVSDNPETPVVLACYLSIT